MGAAFAIAGLVAGLVVFLVHGWPLTILFVVWLIIVVVGAFVVVFE